MKPRGKVKRGISRSRGSMQQAAVDRESKLLEELYKKMDS